MYCDGGLYGRDSTVVQNLMEECTMVQNLMEECTVVQNLMEVYCGAESDETERVMEYF